MKSTIFNINIPQGFELTKDGYGFLRAENNTVEFNIQGPYFSIDLRKISAIQYEEKDTLLDEYITWSEGFKSEVTDTEEITFKDKKTLVVQAKTDAELQNQHFKITYFNALILLDDTWCLDFQFVYETDRAVIYEALATEVFQSITPLGTATAWQTANEADIKITNQGYQAQLKAEQELKEAQENARYKSLAFNPPSTTQSQVNIGSIAFHIIEDQTQWKIIDKQLVVTFQLKTKDIKKAVKQELISEWTDNGEVSLYVSAHNIYNNGIPTGNYIVKEGRLNAYGKSDVSVSRKDFGYGLDFFGKLYLQDGWVALDGWLEASYKKKSFRTTLYKQFDVTTLDWSNYGFTQNDFAQASPAQVSYLSYTDAQLQTLPEAIFHCKNLKELSIYGEKTQWKSTEYVSTYAPILQLPENLRTLVELENLTLHNLSLTQLPDIFNHLPKLASISIHACKIKELPVSLFQLPQLKRLNIDTCEIERIPENINLPQLHWATLKKNKLTTLPEQLALQPNIKHLSLENNPWEYLPDTFNGIEEIELSIADKKRLLDYEYKGTDGAGTVTWDDTIYFAEHDTDLIAPVKEIVNKLPATQYNDALLSLCKRAIGFKETQKEDYARLGNHRFGGYPDLPASIPYPRFGSNWHEEKADYLYEFIAQINCSEIAHLQDYLPRSGMLYFFIKTHHSVYDTPCPTQVIWYDGDARLVSGTQFNFEEDDFYEVTSLPPYTPHKVDAFTMNSFPGLYSANQNPHWFATQRTQALSNIDFYDDMPFDMNDAVEEPISNLAPYNYAMNSYMFTQHESPELQAALKLKGNAQNWIVLLKVTSSSDFQWGDAGDLAFVIHKSDLAKGDFSNVFASIESS